MRGKRALALALAVASLSGASAYPAPIVNVPDGAVFYEIFVRSFQDSNGDGIGDLDGITSRLDYLSELGVDGIWLTPIFPSPSYHGYDTTDYLSVADVYGGMPALQRLLDAAHQRGMLVLLDIAVNHTSNQHPWFIDSKSGATSPLRSRYLWMDHDPNWSQGLGHWYPSDDDGSSSSGSEDLYYASFSQDMPDLNWRDPGTLPEVEKILAFWKDQGVDGFRLDAARYYVKGLDGEADTPETHEVIEQFADQTRDAYPGTFFVGEVWADWDTIFPYIRSGSELDSAFAFPLSGGMIDSLQQGTPAEISSAISGLIDSGVDVDRVSPILTNHDMDRLPTQLGNPDRETQDPQLRLAASFLLTLPGTPFIYYGEEIGLDNGQGPDFAGDLAKRTPMQWTTAPGHGFTNPGTEPWLGFSSDLPELTVESQSADPGSLLEAYQKLISVRHGSPALRSGTLESLSSSAASPLLAFLRRSTADRNLALVAGNFSAAPSPATTYAVTLPGSGKVTMQTLWGSSGAANERRPGQVVVTLPSLPPWSSIILSLTSAKH